MTYSPDNITDDEQYQEAVRQAGRNGNAAHLDRITVFMLGSEWARKRLNPRPEGAEELSLHVSEALCRSGNPHDIADYLAEHGVRLTGKEN